MRIGRTLLLLLGMVSGGSLVAGPYNPAEPTPFSIRPDGAAESLSFNSDMSGQFPQLFRAASNPLDPRTQADGKLLPERAATMARIEKLTEADPPALSPAEVAGLAADYHRVGKTEEALNQLVARSRDRVPDFRILATLAHTYAVRGEWLEALRWHQAAFLDAGFPEDLAGTTPEQRTWLKRVERDYYRRWLQIHRERAETKLDPAIEPVFPLFEGVRFVNEAGEYEPGKLAESERAKLPPDAVAIVQQLLLWEPTDSALYWLLAELYAAEGKLRQAEKILEECSWSRKYSNRTVMMAHRTAVQKAVQQLPPEVDPSEVALDIPSSTTTKTPAPTDTTVENVLPSRGKVIAAVAVFVVLALTLIALQVRAIGRRGRDCGPVG